MVPPLPFGTPPQLMLAPLLGSLFCGAWMTGQIVVADVLWMMKVRWNSSGVCAWIHGTDDSTAANTAAHRCIGVIALDSGPCRPGTARF
jgi:hypothetical protein